ncbi:MAG: hypothetical protein IPM24_21975 [Bryobacterales bacterium]|nr:hypothetical protein [Bryobacterales bacterium]
MIGVVTPQSNAALTAEFFELFKTPWEFCRRDRNYQVVLYIGTLPASRFPASLTVIYSGDLWPMDDPEVGWALDALQQGRDISSDSLEFALYGKCCTFEKVAVPLLCESESGRAVAFEKRAGAERVVRVGYDLLDECRFLVEEGQPAAKAGVAALDCHIEFLRQLINAQGFEWAEVPPVPSGYRFFAALTHDVDHPSLRLHGLDHTALGFLYRATAGSLWDAIRRRLPVRLMLRNWLAALKFPFVHLGLTADFWRTFVTYPDRERCRSTYFVLPFRRVAGRTESQAAPAYRASAYGASDIAGEIRALQSKGCEIALHGIDAWIDLQSARSELSEIRRLTGTQEIGVRMHWLYFGHQSHATLERAGADYDSTVGFNTTVGFRAGTGQVFKPLQVERLLELPLIVMDTALFYASHLDLTPPEAQQRVGGLLRQLEVHGGSLTINWHDRSLSPERQWGRFYFDLLDELRNRGAWMGTATQVVSWFRHRRKVTFAAGAPDPGSFRACLPGPPDGLPGFMLRLHRGDGSFQDLPLEAGTPVAVTAIGLSTSAPSRKDD